MFKKLEKSFVSDEDRFLMECDKNFPLSKSQQEEIAKHKAIAKLRDEKDSKAEDII